MQRKSVTLEEKLDVIKEYECNKHTADIANSTGILKLTSRTVRKQDDKIKECCKLQQGQLIRPHRLGCRLQRDWKGCWHNRWSVNKSSIHYNHSG
jgi:hypothetical protein